MSDGNSYSAAEAAQVLGRSIKRVRQQIQEGKLELVPDSDPVRVTAQSVHELRDTLRTQGAKPGRAPASTGLTFEQVKELVESLTTKALEASQSERAALEAQREKIEAALRAELDQTRAELMQTQARQADLEQELATVRAAPTEEPRRRWWRS
jgi:hypothetical protein